MTGLGEVFYSTGRRGVHIFGVPPDHMVMATVSLLLFGLPVLTFLALIPIWDDVADSAAFKAWHALIAPALNTLTDEYRVEGTQLSLRRVVVASASLVELAFLANFVALLLRRVRKHALLVWLCY